jgi:hypothetical protein
MVLALAIFIAGCVHLVSDYDAWTYRSLTDLKAETLLFLDVVRDNPKATGLGQKLEDLKLAAGKAFEYENGKAVNSETIAQLIEIRKLIDGMARLYQEQGALSPDYLKEKRVQFERAFDAAIATENLKIKQLR